MREVNLNYTILTKKKPKIGYGQDIINIPYGLLR